MTNFRAAVVSVMLIGSLLPAQLCAAYAQASLPQTPAGQKAGIFLAAINSGDAETLAAFGREYYPSQAGNPQMRLIQERTKGLDVTSVDQSTDHELWVSLKSRASGVAIKMRVVVEPNPPHAVRSIGLQF